MDFYEDFIPILYLTSFLLIFVGIPLWLYFKFKKRTKLLFTKIDSDDAYKDISTIKKELAKSFYDRYKGAKVNAYSILVLTILILVTGGLFFFYASNIASREISVSDLSKQQIQQSISNKYFFKYCKEFNISVDSLEKANKTYDVKQKAEDYFARQIALDTYDILSKQAIKPNTDKSDYWYTLITTISIRIIISFFIFYLAQIFLRLYRYNLKVSDFYLNKHDAVLSFKDFNLDFEQTIKLFEHKIDIGDEPKSPVDTAIELLRAVKDIK